MNRRPSQIRVDEKHAFVELSKGGSKIARYERFAFLFGAARDENALWSISRTRKKQRVSQELEPFQEIGLGLTVGLFVLGLA